jgi:hypothetical protein
MKHLLMISLSLFSLSVFAKDPILTCTIKNPKTEEKAAAKINLNKLKDEGAMSKGIDSGKDNYSFHMNAEKVGSEFVIDIMFQENNNVQDEVGGKRCTYSAKKGQRVFCRDNLTADNGWTVAIFYCQVK